MFPGMGKVLDVKQQKMRNVWPDKKASTCIASLCLFGPLLLLLLLLYNG